LFFYLFILYCSETRLHKYSPGVQEGLLTLVLAQLRRLPAALVVDFVLAYADAQPSPMRREWPRRLVSRICQQLRALGAPPPAPLELRGRVADASAAGVRVRVRVRGRRERFVSVSPARDPAIG
jgi:hypothetical protein